MNGLKKYIVLLLVSLGAGASVPAQAAHEEYELPSYKVLFKKGDFEVRHYAPQVIAEATIMGERSGAANRGFRVLADYIFGENATQAKIAMTSPVTQLLAEEVPDAETVETKRENDENTWVLRFKMPKQYTLDTLPKPQNNKIRLLQLPEEYAATVTFSGFWTDSNMNEHAARLAAFLKEHHLEMTGSPYYAFYNDPFTLPWNRRNEVIVTLKPENVPRFAQIP